MIANGIVKGEDGRTVMLCGSEAIPVRYIELEDKRANEDKKGVKRPAKTN